MSITLSLLLLWVASGHATRSKLTFINVNHIPDCFHHDHYFRRQMLQSLVDDCHVVALQGHQTRYYTPLLMQTIDSLGEAPRSLSVRQSRVELIYLDRVYHQPIVKTVVLNQFSMSLVALYPRLSPGAPVVLILPEADSSNSSISFFSSHQQTLYRFLHSRFSVGSDSRWRRTVFLVPLFSAAAPLHNTFAPCRHLDGAPRSWCALAPPRGDSADSVCRSRDAASNMWVLQFLLHEAPRTEVSLWCMHMRRLVESALFLPHAAPYCHSPVRFHVHIDTY